MSDEGQVQSGSELILKIALGVVGVVTIVLLFVVVNLRGRVADLEGTAKNAAAAQKQLEERLHATNADLRNTAEALGSKVGMTQEQIDKRTADLRRQQEASARALSAEQKKTAEALSGVSSEVTGVKSELGGAKTDIATTKSDLEATKSKLEKTIGDLGVQSGLVARNHDELEILKHKGDRNYFEFTLKKKARQPVSTIALELKKTDPKKSKFTLNVMADDKTIEKKDRTASEPLQFYTGRDRSLYELVIFTVTKDTVSGYLSTPKQ
jgi:chromosome segregation ATPase